MAFQFMPGATAVGITFSEGVVLAAEKRVSYGNFVINKNTKKTFLVTDYVGAACAGMIADGIIDKPSIYTLDPVGSVLPDDYAAVGTGAEMALGVLDSEFKKQISRE